MPQKLVAKPGLCAYPGCTDRINVGYFCYEHFQTVLKQHAPMDVIARMIEEKPQEVKTTK